METSIETKRTGFYMALIAIASGIICSTVLPISAPVIGAAMLLVGTWAYFYRDPRHKLGFVAIITGVMILSLVIIAILFSTNRIDSSMNITTEPLPQNIQQQ